MNPKKRTLTLALILAAGLSLTACRGNTSGTTQLPQKTGAIASESSSAPEQAAGGAATPGEPSAGEASGSGEPDAETSPSPEQTSDPTLGGLFELYTPEEYEKVVENVRSVFGAGNADVKNMEEDLEKLRSDNGKGNFVIYKSAFDATAEKDVGTVGTSFNPTIVMRPDLVRRDTPLTAENYRKDIEGVAQVLETFGSQGLVTPEQIERILKKMDENLKALE